MIRRSVVSRVEFHERKEEKLREGGGLTIFLKNETSFCCCCSFNEKKKYELGNDLVKIEKKNKQNCY